MIRVKGQDYYVHEPALLSNGRACVPTRFFQRDQRTFVKAWVMHPVSQEEGWIVSQDEEIEFDSLDLVLSLPEFKKTFFQHQMPDPHLIRGKRLLLYTSQHELC
jgi:hypothetical protein